MKPESRCGRRPTVVRMTRSQDALTAANRTGGCVGTSAGLLFGAQALRPYAAAAMPPVVRNTRRCMLGSPAILAFDPSGLTLQSPRDREEINPRRVGAAVAPCDPHVDDVRMF